MQANSTKERIVDLARASSRAAVAELIVDSDPIEHVVSAAQDLVTSLPDSGLVLGAHRTLSQPVIMSSVGPEAGLPDWVKSFAVVPVTGPAAETGWIAVAGTEAGAIRETDLAAIQGAASLIEECMDRSVEQIRLDALGDLLRSNQRVLQDTRDRLQVSNQELEQFAYIAAHELVAPLRAVAVYAELLEELAEFSESESGVNARSCAVQIREGVTQMNQQVRSLLDLSKAQSDTTSLEEVDLGFVVDKALDTLAVPLSEIDATVTVGPLPKVLARTVPLQSVFANLISNAVRYRDPNRPLEVDIASSESASGWSITVGDNGIGVDEADRTRIFQLFERATQHESGTGIGLALTRRILEAYGATVSVDGGDPHGSIFRLHFPTADI